MPHAASSAAAPAAPAHPVVVPRAVRRELNRAQAQLRREVARLPPGSAVQVLRRPDAVVLRVPARVLFEPDSAALSHDRTAKRLVAMATRLLARRRRLSARVEVYTDNIGGAERNRSFSQQRADAMVTALTGAGIVAGRLTGQGQGLVDALASNDTPQGRLRNRRVEIVFERAAPPGTAAASRAALRPARAAARAGA